MVLELIGRYILTGIVLMGTLFLMAIARILWTGYKMGDIVQYMACLSNEIDEPTNSADEKIRKIKPIIRFCIWPYGLLIGIYDLMKAERKATKRMISEYEKE